MLHEKLRDSKVLESPMYSLGYNTVIAVFTIELTHGKWRTLLGHCLCEIGWSIGHASMGGLVAGVRDMSTLEMVIALSGVPFMLLWYFMPESPRWLLAKGRKDKVMSTVPSLRVCNQLFLSLHRNNHY